MPTLQSQRPTMARGVLIDLLDGAFSGTPWAGFDSPRIGLFTAGPTPITPFSLSSDFTPAAFSGYASVQMVPTTNINVPSGDGVGAAKGALFTRTATSGTDDLIQGYYVWDSTANIMIAAEYFDAPVPIAAIGDFIDLLFVYALMFQPNVS